MFRGVKESIMDINKIVDIIRNLNEEGMAGLPANNASSGAIAGLPPDQPPVDKKKKKRYIYGKGYRKLWQVK